MPQIDVLCLCQQYDLRGVFGPGFERFSDIRLITPDEVTDPASIRYVLAFRPAADAFDRLPNVEMICSIGAGVDGLLRHPGLRPDMAVVRMINPQQAEMMAGFAAWYVVGHHREMARYGVLQAARSWQTPAQPQLPSQFPVAVLGYGKMGQAIGRALGAMGYPVTGWAARARTQDGVQVLSGEDGLARALSGAGAVIGVLPLTDQTSGFFNARRFAMMRRDAILIQLGRGGHLIEDDLIAALDAGRPALAALDVTQVEPLPKDSPLWSHPRVMLTPHIASDSDGAAIAQTVSASIRAHQAGQTPQGLVDRSRGY